MNDLNKSLSELDALIAKHEEVQNQMFCHYVKIVNAILRNEITSEQVIKKIMDGLANFEDEGFFWCIGSCVSMFIIVTHNWQAVWIFSCVWQ